MSLQDHNAVSTSFEALLSTQNMFCWELRKEAWSVLQNTLLLINRSVWHAGPVHKLKAAGDRGEVLKWFTNYTYIIAGVAQGSLFGPVLFLAYINGIVAEIGSNIHLFSDDTSSNIIVENPVTSAVCLNSDRTKISIWASHWLVDFNPITTESMLISRILSKSVHPLLFMQEVQ